MNSTTVPLPFQPCGDDSSPLAAAVHVNARSGRGAAARPRTRAELLLVYRAELARLLRWAARGVHARRGAAGGAAHWSIEADRPRRERLGVAALRAWRARAARVLELLAGDGFDLPETGIVQRLVATACAAWPDAGELAEQALLCRDAPLARSTLAQIWLERRRAPEALRLLRGGRALAGGRALDWRALELLGSAHETCGNDRLALGALAAAARSGTADGGVAAGAVLLALACRDEPRARRAARGLERRAAIRPAELGAAVERARRRVLDLRAPGLGWCERDLLDDLAARGPAVRALRNALD